MAETRRWLRHAGNSSDSLAEDNPHRNPRNHQQPAAHSIIPDDEQRRRWRLLNSYVQGAYCCRIIQLGSRSTPLCDTEGSVHRERLKQHGLRCPALSFEHATSIRRLRVSGCLVEPIQRIQSQRAIGVISIHRVRACGSAARAFFKSAGSLGSGQSLVGSIASITVSPAFAPAASRMVLSILNQWLPLPSGSSAA
jgi:hypothetical protein